jgi:hypothetical protein
VCKQTNGNPSETSIVRGFELFNIALSSFPASEDFREYLGAYLARNYYESGIRSVRLYSEYALHSLQKVSRGGRRGLMDVDHDDEDDDNDLEDAHDDRSYYESGIRSVRLYSEYALHSLQKVGQLVVPLLSACSGGPGTRTSFDPWHSTKVAPQMAPSPPNGLGYSS